MTNSSPALTGAMHRSLFSQLPRFTWRRFSDGVELKATAVFPKDHNSDSQATAFFFFHGGMWKIGDPTEFSPWALHLAEQGIVSILFEYRQTQTYDVNGPQILEDAQEAWKWMQENAHALGIDSRKMVAAGSDAGGLMALLLAMRGGKPTKKQPAPPSPAAMVVFRGIVDCGKKSLLHHYFPSEKEAKHLSPINLVRKELPALFLAIGGRDKLVPSDPAVKFSRLYKRKKNSIRFLLLEESDQSFYHFNINATVFEFTLQELLLFLSENGLIKKLDGPAESQLIL